MARALAGVTASYNAAFHKALGYSPYYVMYGREYRTPLDLAIGIGNASYGNTTIDYVDQLQQNLKDACVDVNERLKTYTQRMKQRYDSKVKGIVLQEGQFALHTSSANQLNAMKRNHKVARPTVRRLQALREARAKLKPIYRQF